MESVPEGYKECDGTQFETSEYPELFAVIGDTYSKTNNASAFNVPDYRGAFLRGWDHGAGMDPDAGARTVHDSDKTDMAGDHVGSRQGDDFGKHSHPVPTYSDSGDSGNIARGGTGTERARSTSDKGGKETRPKNVSIMFIIKYKSHQP